MQKHTNFKFEEVRPREVEILGNKVMVKPYITDEERDRIAHTCLLSYQDNEKNGFLKNDMYSIGFIINGMITDICTDINIFATEKITNEDGVETEESIFKYDTMDAGGFFDILKSNIVNAQYVEQSIYMLINDSYRIENVLKDFLNGKFSDFLDTISENLSSVIEKMPEKNDMETTLSSFVNNIESSSPDVRNLLAQFMKK